MSSDEDDYMSDAFLTKTVEDVRPGLIKSRAKIREHEIQAKKARFDQETRRKCIPLKHLEAERRDEGLNVAIAADNKGFAMLAKMGYKQGDAIGRTAQGIVEPIGIQIKNDRGGLGRETALRQLQERREEIRKQKLLKFAANKETISAEEYRKRMTQKANEKQLEADLGKCQRACEKLDLEQSISQPAMSWFWPIREIPQSSERDNDGDNESEETVDDDESTSKDGNEDDEIEYETTEKLEMVNDYLRITYCYCHWCGVKYEDTNDMEKNCPGLLKDDH